MTRARRGRVGALLSRRRRPARGQAGEDPRDQVAAPGPAGEGPAADRSASARLDSAVGTASRWTQRSLVLGAGLVVVGFGLAQIWSIVLPVLLALLLATVLRPPTRLLARSLPDALAALLSLIALLGVVAALVAVLAPRVRAQTLALLSEIDFSLDRLQQAWAQPAADLGFGPLSDLVDASIDRLQQNSDQLAAAVVGGALTGALGVGSVVITAALALTLTFFVVKDADRFLPWATRWVGARAGRHVDALGRRVWATLGGFIWSQAAVSLVDAVFIGLGLWLLDVPFAAALAVLIFFAGFIPIVGALSTGVLAVLVALISHGVWTAVAVLVLVVVVQQLESNVLQPVLVGRVLALHPGVVLASVTAGATLAGITGAFLAVPAVAVATVVLRYLREQLTDDA